MANMKFVKYYKNYKIYSISMHNGYAGSYSGYYCPEIGRTFGSLRRAEQYIDMIGGI